MLGLLSSCCDGDGGGGGGGNTCDWNYSNSYSFVSLRLLPPTQQVYDSYNMSLYEIYQFPMLFWNAPDTKIILSVTVADTYGCNEPTKTKEYSKTSNYNEIGLVYLSGIPATSWSASAHSATLTIVSAPYYDNKWNKGYVLWEKKFDTNTLEPDKLEVRGKFVLGTYGVKTLSKPPSKVYINDGFQVMSEFELLK